MSNPHAPVTAAAVAAQSPPGRIVPQPGRPSPGQGAGSRMSLASITAAKPFEGLRIMLYTPEGLGKTTWASHAPNPVFLHGEKGLPIGVRPFSFPTPRNWREVQEAVGALISEPHNFQTLVFDTIDWLMPLLYAATVAADNQRGVKSKETGQPVLDVEDYDYMKGYKRAAALLHRFLRGTLDVLCARRRMNVIMLAHSEVRLFNNPEGANYDRYQPKMHPDIAAMLQEWCDIVLFGNFAAPQVITAKGGKGGDPMLRKGKALYDDRRMPVRLVYTERRPQFNAKNRHGLPFSMPLDWQVFAKAIDLSGQMIQARIQDMRQNIAGLAAQIENPETRLQVEQWVNNLPNEAASLGKMAAAMNRIRGIIMEEAEARARADSDMLNGSDDDSGNVVSGDDDADDPQADASDVGASDVAGTTAGLAMRVESDEDPTWMAGVDPPADDDDESAAAPVAASVKPPVTAVTRQAAVVPPAATPRANTRRAAPPRAAG